MAGWAVASVCVDGEESGSYEWNAGSLRPRQTALERGRQLRTEADSLGLRQVGSW